MGSSGEGNPKVIDGSVGGLVWVRRRNGSWWPGRILGADELPESCVVSPRSGTPVKLLGREDASLDWYNLEKSKRVKAFRCGEYDECIEKAKASAANSSKKTVKYARREDAIIHALELESARRPKNFPELGLKIDKPDVREADLNEPSSRDEETEHKSDDSSSSEDTLSSAQELSQSGVSFEEPNHFSVSKEQSVQGRRRKTPNDSEDDGTEGTKRMRGLEDLGMGVVSSFKRKRSQVANVHEFLKKKSRRRQLAKVLESTAMVTVPVMCEELASPVGMSMQGVSESKVSGLDSNESKRSLSVVINNNSDSTGVSCENANSLNASELACDASLVNCKQKENEISSMLGLPKNNSSDRLFDVPFVGEEKHPAGFSSIFLSCPSQKLRVGAGARSSQSSLVETAISLGNEEFNESGSTSSGTADIGNINHIETDTSKWQSKGKRNSRHTIKNRKPYSKKPTDADGVFSLGWSRPSMRAPPDEVSAPQRLLPYRQSRFTINPKYQTSDLPLRNYGADSSLYDVPVDVKTGYRPQHVPYISLMSKLNGRPIIGHPVTVEAVDEGFCDVLIKGAECYSSSCELKADAVYEVGPTSGNRRIPTKHPTMELRVSPSKSHRKSGLLSKKIRKLSSLTGSHKQSIGEKKPIMEKLKGPAVACVPLKVVFSRINAALNGSMRPAHRVMTPGKP